MFRALNTFSGNNVKFLETEHDLNNKYPWSPISSQNHCLVRSLRHATPVFWLKNAEFLRNPYFTQSVFQSGCRVYPLKPAKANLPTKHPNKYYNPRARFILNTVVTSSCPVTMARFNPSLGNDPYSQLSAQIQQKFLANQQTSDIYDRKNRWRDEIEGIVKTLYPSCRLVLSGSSANGFGNIHSDIDLVLCFEGSATARGYMLSRIESLFTRSPRRFQTEVMFK